jgi:hypothetical protein
MRTITIKIPDALDTLTADELGLLVQQADDLTKMFKTVKTFAAARLAAGQPVTGYEWGDGKRSREWLSEEDAKKAMAAQGINDFYKPQELLSVAEAEKKVSDIEALKVAWKWVPGAKTMKAGPVSAATAVSAKPNYGF